VLSPCLKGKSFSSESLMNEVKLLDFSLKIHIKVVSIFKLVAYKMEYIEDYDEQA